ncbi:MAG: nitroreductase family deazaflavin-dependent oxidoreductase [Acidobacteria bacterium]|nr:nitroreductase family deazaflavin-dependent oxidoreductase [Acidobacteriota bacterium]
MPRSARPRGLLRLFLRFPIVLYRIRLGWLLGGRFLMMTHIGRRSGQPRRVILEVVRHDRKTNTCVIASGWGEQSNWIRNIERIPAVTVQVGLRKWPASATRLTSDAGERELADYAIRHPASFRGLVKWYQIDAAQIASTKEICRQMSSRIPLFVLQPQPR